VDFFDPDRTPRSVRTIAKVFEGKKTVKDTLVRNWLRATFVAKDLDNNSDSTSQLQIEPELPEYFSVEQSSTFYTDLQIGFDDDDHTFGTTVANGTASIRLSSQNQWKRSSTSTMSQRVMYALEPQWQHQQTRPTMHFSSVCSNSRRTSRNKFAGKNELKKPNNNDTQLLLLMLQ
jgi:hypothetical protein